MQYKQTGLFRGSDATPLESVHGVSSNRGQVVLYDGAAPRLFVLDDALRSRSHFGRVGGGPGELVDRLLPGAQPYTANPVLLTDSLIYLADANALKIYRHDGTFVRQDSRIRSRAPITFDILGLHVAKFGLVYAHERSDYMEGVRTVDTWVIDSNERKRIYSFELPARGERIGQKVSFYAGPREARPLWGAFGNCAFVGDGASSWLLRIDLPSGRVDSLRIPPHEVPPYRPDPKRDAAMQRFFREREIPNRATRPPQALRRYAGLIVDPDGHIWIKPWRAPNEKVSPVFRIDPQGNAYVESLPAFPIAFGPAGVFYAIDKDPETDEVLLIRYEITS